MRAVVKAKAGPGVEVVELPNPEPGPDEVVIKVSGVGICGGDIGIYDSNQSAISGSLDYPFIPGHETCGEVVKVGAAVAGISPGERIAVETHIPCGGCYSCGQGYLNLCDNLRIFGVTRGTNGAFAEYAVVPSVVAYKIPPEVTDDYGAILEPFGVGVHAIKVAGVTVGDRTTVLGCGPIGLFIIALLKHAGATEIIASDPSEYRLDLARKMGATMAVNPTQDDLAKVARELTDNVGPQVVFEASGNSKALAQAFDIIAKRGRLVLVAGHPSTPPLNFTKDVHLKETTVTGIYGREIWNTWDRAVELVKHRAIDLKPAMTHRFPLDKIDDAIGTAKRAESGKIIVVP